MIQNFKDECRHTWKKESTPLDSKLPGIKVSTHALKSSTPEDSVQEIDFAIESIDT